VLARKCIALSALALLWGTAAHAATVEPKVKLLVRERPTTSARIVDRVPAGKKLPLLGKTADGSWSHVDTGKHEGWVPSSQLRGKGAATPQKAVESDDGEEEVVQRPLAKRRGVRSEAWVSSSRYHDGENNKLSVSSTKAELYGRPASGGTVVGVVRRGDVVDLVRRSGDKKWCLVDIGGGEVAWIDVRHVRTGAFRAAPADMQQEVEAEEPPPRHVKKQVVVADREPVEVERERPPVEEEAPPPPPPPPVKRAKREKAPPPPAAEEPEPTPPVVEEKLASKEDEAPPLTADDDAPKSKKDKKKRKKDVRLASTDDDAVRMAARRSRGSGDATLVATPAENGAGNNFLGIGARAGVAIISQRFTSNGTGALTNYDAGTDALGVQVGLGYTRAIGRYFRLGLDGSYEFAGAAGVRYHTTDGSQVVLGMQNHVIDFGAQLGVHINAIGGIELRVRLGGEMMVDLMQGSAKAPLPSDRILGMTVGAAIAAPNLLTLGHRPFGVHLFGWALVPAQRAQTIGLEEGTKSSTIGATFGGGLAYGLYKGLSLSADYSYGFVLTHYTGQAVRNTSISEADRGNSQHLITLGLAYNY
jgi:uncharacterized protein YgiM (DUF1202 family)